MKVLIIEDDPGIVTAIDLLFQISWPEAQLISAQQGEEGIELVKNEAPDVVVLDLGLPDIDGFEVLKRLRLFSTVPIVILTARAEKDAMVRGLELGANDYIVKPFRQWQFLERVKAQVAHLIWDGLKSASMSTPITER